MKTIPEIKISVSEEQDKLIQKMIAETGKPEIKAVSFRLSGILINLPFSEREDLFLIMEQNFRRIYKGRKFFVDLRISAENKAGTLDEIYDLIMKQTKITQADRDMLMNTECRLFKESAFSRNFGKILFNEASRKNKEIIVVSDTVYPEKVIEDVLAECRYESPKMTVIRRSANQSVYDAVIEKCDVPPEKLLHIGSDVSEDVEKPVMNGSKALLLADTVPLMVKSGRLRGYVQSERLYDYDSADFFALHCAFGLYASYLFDLPKSRVYQSDFCADAYMIGFMVFGTLKLARDFQPTEFQRKIISAAEKNTEIMRGADDFVSLFSAHLKNIFCDSGNKGLELPFEFFEKHSAPVDRNMLKGLLDDNTLKEWESIVTAPKTAPVYIKTSNPNGLSKLADKMFPPGTKVRNIADGILVKMKQKAKL